MRNKIDPNQHGFFERFLINIPFVLIVALIVAFIGAGFLLLFYSFVTIVAFKSAMIFLTILGGGFFGIGIGLSLITVFNKYHVYYEKKMDIYFPKEIETKTNNKTFKDYITFANISYSIVLIGAVFTIISALLGSTNRDNWVKATSPYLESNGYYADVKLLNLQISTDDDNNFISDFDDINISFNEKTAVIIFNEDEDKKSTIVISTYIQYEKQVIVSQSRSNKIINISDNTSPQIEQTTLNRLLFFMYKDNYFEKQVKIYIPLDLKDKINIIVNNENNLIIAQ